MNYTDNYKLPQWEEEDRVMRTDFNQMCADIDEGLSGLSGGLAEAREEAARQAQAARDHVAGSIYRAAYNHWSMLAEAEEQPRQLGLFRQRLDGAALPSGVKGMLQREGFAWTARGGAEITGETLKAAATETSSLFINKNMPGQTSSLVVTFTAPSGILLNNINLGGDYRRLGSDNRFDFQLVLTNMTTGQTEIRKTLSSQMSESGYSIGFTINWYLRTGHKYKLELVPMSSTYDMVFGLKNETKGKFHITSYDMEPAELSWTMSEETSSKGGLVLARYTTCGQAGTPTLQWDGKTLTPRKVRTITDGQGRTMQEAEFKRDEAISARSSMKLMLNCPENGEMSLYCWGAVLI